MLTMGFSRRYAKALFLEAKQHNILDCIEKEVDIIRQVLDNNQDFCRFINSPVNLKKKLLVIKKISSALELSKLFSSFLQVLALNDRLRYIAEILQEFNKQALQDMGIKEVCITSAIELNKKDINSIQKSLEDALKCKIKIDLVIDKKIMAGLVVSIGSYLYDASLKGRMDRVVTEAKLQINAL
jgi:F-type H+-transporting ATPase subunit delta